MSATISIVTPLFNNEKYVSETIFSVINQTYTDWEMVIIDDGSTDGSYDIVKNFASKDSRIRLYHRERLPKGGNVCRNIGIEKSRGKYIIFLDADDLLYPSCLENRVKLMESKKDLDFAVFQMDTFSPSGKIKDRILTHHSENYLYSFLSHNLPWQTTCPIWNINFLKEVLVGFDERFLRLQDPEFHTRALLVKNVKFEVYSGIEYTDCSYRVDYKNPNLSLFLDGCKLYIETFIEKIKKRADKKECINALGGFFDNIYSHYSTSSKEDMKFNIPKITYINKFFASNQLIPKKLYFKAQLFLICIKYNLFNSKLFNFTLRKLGFNNFYGYQV